MKFDGCGVAVQLVTWHICQKIMSSMTQAGHGLDIGHAIH